MYKHRMNEMAELPSLFLLVPAQGQCQLRCTQKQKNTWTQRFTNTSKKRFVDKDLSKVLGNYRKSENVGNEIVVKMRQQMFILVYGGSLLF